MRSTGNTKKAGIQRLELYYMSLLFDKGAVRTPTAAYSPGEKSDNARLGDNLRDGKHSRAIVMMGVTPHKYADTLRSSSPYSTYVVDTITITDIMFNAVPCRDAAKRERMSILTSLWKNKEPQRR
jgi:hypothetical protein